MNYIITKIVEPSLKDKELLSRNLSLKSEKHKYKFKLIDDDGFVYYEGLSKNNFSFEPLDNFGKNVGCTEIHYFENEKFIML